MQDMEWTENTLANEPRCHEDNEEYELVRVMAVAGDKFYHFPKKDIVHIRENELVVRTDDGIWRIRNAVIIEVTRPVAKEPKQNDDVKMDQKTANTSENKVYYIHNTVAERHSEIKGYFSTLEKAKEALKECSDWFRPKGTGRIYSVNLDVLNDKPKLEYESQ